MGLSDGSLGTAAYPVPEGWDVKRIGDLAEIATGSTPPTVDTSNYGDEFLFVSPADINDAKWVTRTGKMLSEKGFKNARRFPAGSVLFVCIGSTIGKCAIASVELTSNQQINAVFPSPKHNSEFLYYALSWVSAGVRGQAGEQAVPLVNKTQFSDTAILLPSPSEQHAIATALSDVDALIAGLEKLIAKKRDLKQAAMQQLLTGQTRLPGFKQKWGAKKLGDLIHLIPGGVYGEERARDQLRGRPVATTAHIDMDDTWNDKEMGVRFFTDGQIERYSPKAGDLIVVKSSGSAASIQSGKIGFVDQLKDGAFIFSNFLMLLRPLDVVPKYLYFYLCSPYVKSKLPSLVEASTYPNIRIPEYLDIDVPLPGGDEQAAIAAILEDMDVEISALGTRLTKTRALKQGMMQELLTGRTRLLAEA